MPSPGPFTAHILDSYQPWLQYDPSGDLTAYLSALGGMFDEVALLVSEQGYPDDPDYVPGWSTLLDPDACPTQFLPWLAQFIGATVPPGTDDATARTIVKGEAGFRRGTPAAVVAAAKQWLAGTQSCVLYERTAVADFSEDAYHFLLLVRPEEVISVGALTAAVNAVKPAGLMWDLLQTDGWLINQVETTYATISAFEAAFSTVTRAEEDQVG